MKMRQVSKGEWITARKEYERRARELSHYSEWYYSTELISCKYQVRYCHYDREQGVYAWSFHQPRTYRSVRKAGVAYLAHFSERQCHSLPMGVKVVCLAQTGSGKSTQYWLGEHAVGRCPHKAAPGEVRT